VYRELADVVVQAGGRRPEALAGIVVSAARARLDAPGGGGRRGERPLARSARAEDARISLEPIRVRVELAERGYDVLVGPGVRAEVSGCLPSGARRATVVTRQALGVEVDPGVPYQVVTIPDGEQAKSLATVEEICRFMARSDMHRDDVVVAVGGGVVTTWPVTPRRATTVHRGHPRPTTLLGQIDAAIGGKTGVNLPEGKNLVGSLWQPVGVFCDTKVLRSLPAREWRSGHGEMAKYAFFGRGGPRQLEP